MDNFTLSSYDADKEALLRKEKLVNAMMSGALAPLDLPQQTGPVASKVNPLQAIAKVLEGYLAGKSGKALDEEKSNFEQKYNDRLKTGIEEYTKNSQGYDVPNGPYTNPTSAQMTHVPGDKKAAIMSALASNHPILQQLAMSELSILGNGQLTPKDLLALATPESVLQNPSSTAGWQPKRKLTEVTPGTPLVDEAGNFTEPGGTPPWKEVMRGNDRYMETITGLKKLDNAPNISVSASASPVIAGQKAGMEAFWKGPAEQVNQLGKSAATAQNLLPKIERLKSLSKQGIFTNATANIASTLSNLAQVAGAKIDTGKLARTEDYNAEITKIWVDMIKDSGGARGWTEPETKRIEKALPQIISSPQAMQDMLQLMEGRAKKEIELYKNANKAFARAAKADDPELFADEFQNVFLPEITAIPPTIGETPTDASKPTVSNW